jgi:dephospho-CoA kinase
MLRAGLTGGLGSGKTTVAAIFRSLGAHILEADAIGRELMQPGQPVYDAIVAHFGPAVIQPSRELNRKALAELAFRHNRLAELNHLVHPAVIAEQERRAKAIFAEDPHAIVIVESALIFEAGGKASRETSSEAQRQPTIPNWSKRFDSIILVTAPVELRIARYVERMRQQPNAHSIEEIEADARARIAAQIPDSEKIPLVHYVIENDGHLEKTQQQTKQVFEELKQLAQA